ncbi:MAG: hypothetical protein AAB932_05325 [Patescibacteria group bacterium]
MKKMDIVKIFFKTLLVDLLLIFCVNFVVVTGNFIINQWQEPDGKGWYGEETRTCLHPKRYAYGCTWDELVDNFRYQFSWFALQYVIFLVFIPFFWHSPMIFFVLSLANYIILIFLFRHFLQTKK